METLQEVLTRILVEYLERKAQRERDTDREISQPANPTTSTPKV
jgi:hypothetical protein